MKKTILSVVAILLFCLVKTSVASAAVATQSGVTNITVTIAGNTLNVNGYIAPFASVVLTIDGNVITSTTADANGDFSFSNVVVPKATSTVCFDSVDYKKLGASEACISVTPIDGVISKSGVFLPPTLGVQRTDVTVGDGALLFGYGMPGAKVTVHLNSAVGCEVTTETTGYYTCTITIQKTGQNELFADATLNGRASEAQLKKILIQGITLVKPTTVPTQAPFQLPGFPQLFAIPWWVWLLLVLIVIILIIILLRKYRPEAIPAVGVPKVQLRHAFDFLFKSKKLHHWWMKGVGY